MLFDDAFYTLYNYFWEQIPQYVESIVVRRSSIFSYVQILEPDSFLSDETVAVVFATFKSFWLLLSVYQVKNYIWKK